MVAQVVRFWTGYAEIKEINDRVEAKLKASGQTLNTISSNWLSRIAGSTLGGVASQHLDLKWVYALSSIICLLAVIVLFSIRCRATMRGIEVE
jgi:predicted MFS family arabinose efflux permease